MSTVMRVLERASTFGRLIGVAILVNVVLLPFALASAPAATSQTEGSGDGYCCRKASNNKMYCCASCYCSLSEPECSSSDDCSIG